MQIKERSDDQILFPKNEEVFSVSEKDKLEN